MNRYFLKWDGVKKHLKLCIIEVDAIWFSWFLNYICFIYFAFQSIIYGYLYCGSILFLCPSTKVTLRLYIHVTFYRCIVSWRLYFSTCFSWSNIVKHTTVTPRTATGNFAGFSVHTTIDSCVVTTLEPFETVESLQRWTCRLMCCRWPWKGEMFLLSEEVIY